MAVDLVSQRDVALVGRGHPGWRGPRVVAYLISPLQRSTTWEIDRNRLITAAAGQWAFSDLRVADDGVMRGRVTGTVRTEAGDLVVSQNRAGPDQALQLDGPIEAVAEFAAWWRRQVPDSQELVLYDESFSDVVPLQVGMSAQAILD